MSLCDMTVSHGLCQSHWQRRPRTAWRSASPEDGHGQLAVQLCGQGLKSAIASVGPTEVPVAIERKCKQPSRFQSVVHGPVVLKVHRIWHIWCSRQLMSLHLALLEFPWTSTAHWRSEQAISDTRHPNTLNDVTVIKGNAVKWYIRHLLIF